MPAYVIVDIEVANTALSEEYKKLARPAAQAIGGRCVVRGGAAETPEGDGQPGRMVVLECSAIERAKEWIESQVRQPA